MSDSFAICRLTCAAEIPAWALSGIFSSITRTPDELSIVCTERQIPEGINREGGWRVLKVEGPLDFSLTGILASITVPLAEAAIPVFALSTYQTDYIMIRRADLVKAEQVLSRSRHNVLL